MGKALENKFTYNEAKYLISKGVICKGTEISYNLLGKIYNTPIINILDDNERVLFVVYHNYDKIMISNNGIITVDGMNPHKLFEAYNDDLEDIVKIKSKTNVEKDIIGKDSGFLEDIELYNGLKIILENDINKKYNNKVFTIKGLGDKIILVGQRGRPKKAS